MDEGITPSLSFDDLSGLICISIQAKTHESPLKEGNHGHDLGRAGLGSWMSLWWIALGLSHGCRTMLRAIRDSAGIILLSLILCLVWLRNRAFCVPSFASSFALSCVASGESFFPSSCFISLPRSHSSSACFGLQSGLGQRATAHPPCWFFVAFSQLASHGARYPSAMLSHLCVILPPFQIISYFNFLRELTYFKFNQINIININIYATK